MLTLSQVRDLRSIYQKLIQVLYPPRQGHNREVLRQEPLIWTLGTKTDVIMLVSFRDWDLWGPLVLCLGLGALLSLNVRASGLGILSTDPDPP